MDRVGEAADAVADPRFLRLENLDTDLRPPQVALDVTRAAISQDDANSYLPFQGHLALREAAAAHVAAATGRPCPVTWYSMPTPLASTRLIRLLLPGRRRVCTGGLAARLALP
jgi:hypothetical protein